MLDKMAELNNRLINYDEETESIPRIEIDNEFHQLIYECSGEQLAKNIIKTQMSHYNRIRYLAELNKNISVKTNDEHNMLIDAIRNKDKRMYLRVIKAHISRIFNELDKLKGIYPEYFEKIEVNERNSPYIRIFLYHYIKKIKMTDVIYYHYVSLF